MSIFARTTGRNSPNKWWQFDLSPGLANRLLRELGLSAEEIAEFKREQSSATTYHAHLNLLRKWFGIVFVGLDE